MKVEELFNPYANTLIYNPEDALIQSIDLVHHEPEVLQEYLNNVKRKDKPQISHASFRNHYCVDNKGNKYNSFKELKVKTQYSDSYLLRIIKFGEVTKTGLSLKMIER